MKIADPIQSAEIRFKYILELFFKGIYDEFVLPSHGLDHHRRVWNYSKDLLNLAPGLNQTNIFSLPSKLIIACYLHDIGMSVEKGIRHGMHSKDLCTEFLIKNNLSVTDFHDVLEAIEYHDKKDYSGDNDVSDLLRILSSADDLDAFGYTGIYRYLEIYLTRGISLSEIGYRINENAIIRFDNFEKIFISAPEFVAKHKARFEILYKFFTNYNKQVTEYKFGSPQPSGYCGVAELIADSMNKKQGLEFISKNYVKIGNDPVIQDFLKELASDLTTD